jgi:hypothetical protein
VPRVRSGERTGDRSSRCPAVRRGRFPGAGLALRALGRTDPPPAGRRDPALVDDIHRVRCCARRNVVEPGCARRQRPVPSAGAGARRHHRRCSRPGRRTRHTPRLASTGADRLGTAARARDRCAPLRRADGYRPGDDPHELDLVGRARHRDGRWRRTRRRCRSDVRPGALRHDRVAGAASRYSTWRRSGCASGSSG